MTDLLVEFDVGKDGVDPPRLTEHGSERQGESEAEDPQLQLDIKNEGGGGNDNKESKAKKKRSRQTRVKKIAQGKET